MQHSSQRIPNNIWVLPALPFSPSPRIADTGSCLELNQRGLKNGRFEVCGQWWALLDRFRTLVRAQTVHSGLAAAAGNVFGGFDLSPAVQQLLLDSPPAASKISLEIWMRKRKRVAPHRKYRILLSSQQSSVEIHWAGSFGAELMNWSRGMMAEYTPLTFMLGAAYEPSGQGDDKDYQRSETLTESSTCAFPSFPRRDPYSNNEDNDYAECGSQRECLLASQSKLDNLRLPLPINVRRRCDMTSDYLGRLNARFTASTSKALASNLCCLRPAPAWLHDLRGRGLRAPTAGCSNPGGLHSLRVDKLCLPICTGAFLLLPTNYPSA